MTHKFDVLFERKWVINGVLTPFNEVFTLSLIQSAETDISLF